MKTIFSFSLGCVLLFAQLTSAAPSKDAVQEAALKSFVKLYQASKTSKDLIKKLPQATQEMVWLTQKTVKDQPLPAISFDSKKLTLQMKGLPEIRFVDAANGKFEVGGKEFVYHRLETFTQNTLRFNDLLKTKSVKSAWLNWIWPEAEAQNRDFFPPAGKLQEDVWVSGAKGVQEEMVVTMGGVTASQAALYTTASESAVFGLGMAPMAVFPLHYATQYAHAYIVGDSCDSQVDQLKQIMNEGHISLAGLNCTDYFSNAKMISFWTPDKKELPFVADWNASQLWVDQNKEWYQFKAGMFNNSDLDFVQKKGANGFYRIGHNDKGFAEYKKNLEAYRRVLYVFGVNNSCYKCEAQFKEQLVKEEPGTYTTGKAGAPGGGEATQ